MKIAPVAEVKAQFSSYLKLSAEGPIVVTRHGKELVAIVPAEDLELLERLRQFASRTEMDAALRELDDGEGVSWESLKSELGL